MGKAIGSEKTGGRKAGTRNKRTLLATEILADIKHTIASSRKKTGYCPIQMQVMFIEKAYNLFEKCFTDGLLKDAAEYLRMAIMANSKLMDKIHGNIEIQKTDSAITADDIIKLMGEVEMIKDYKPINDPDSGLKPDDDEDDL